MSAADSLGPRGSWVAQLTLSAMLTGLIWVVQVELYPLFAEVRPEDFGAFHAEHMRRIAWIVVPLMLAELGLALGGVKSATGRARRRAWGLLGLVGVVWLSTGLVQVRLHQELTARGRDLAVIAMLVSTNWIRTIAWTVRTVWLAREVSMAGRD